MLPRTVVVLGVASLLNDAASEMVTPLLPLFLTATLGAGPAVIGLIEGLAQSLSSIVKLLSGRLADLGWQHKRLILGGYGLANVARPLIGLAGSWPVVLGLRCADRLGKGLRAAPRDALMAAAVAREARGRAFGFHRAMDHAGAMLGPLFAFALLARGLEMRTVFMVSLVPGILLMLLISLGVPRRPDGPPAPASPQPMVRMRELHPRARALLLAASAVAFAGVPDAFLVLWASNAGVTLVWVPLLWAAAHALRSALAGAGGVLADRTGRIPIMIVGWSLRVLVLAMLAGTEVGIAGAWVLFLAFAASTALTEPAEMALIGDLAPAGQQATVFGAFHMFTGLAILPGALLFGAIWQWLDMRAAFLTAAVLTALSAGMLIVLSRGAPR